MSIAIVGATGHIGSDLVPRLLDAGADVTLLVRDPSKLGTVRSRATVLQGDVQDREFVQRATRGADALLWMTPLDLRTTDLRTWYETWGANAAAAVRANRIPYVVHISSIGAQLPNAGPISGVGQVERHLDGTDANITHLRGAFYMENYLMQVDAVRTRGAIFLYAPDDIPIPQIATRDIAEVAAKLLLSRDWSGKRVRGLHGPADLTFGEAAQAIGQAIGHSLSFVSVSRAEASTALAGMGFSASVTEAYLDMLSALLAPGASAEKRTPETTTPTTLQEWARGMLRPLVARAA